MRTQEEKLRKIPLASHMTFDEHGEAAWLQEVVQSYHSKHTLDS